MADQEAEPHRLILGLPAACPNCGRSDALVVLGDATFCAACGYSTYGVSGCT